MWCLTTVIPARGKLRQEGNDLKANLGYIVRLCLNQAKIYKQIILAQYHKISSWVVCLHLLGACLPVCTCVHKSVEVRDSTEAEPPRTLLDIPKQSLQKAGKLNLRHRELFVIYLKTESPVMQAGLDSVCRRSCL